MTKLVFALEGERSDLDWLRQRAEGALEDVLAEATDEGRLDDDVSLWSEYQD